MVRPVRLYMILFRPRIAYYKFFYEIAPTNDSLILIEMKVMKFGGTSVGSASAILRVKRIVEQSTENTVVVVSAMGGITDRLIHTAATASQGVDSYADELKYIIGRHRDTIAELLGDTPLAAKVRAKTDAMLDELSNIYRGVHLIKDLSDRTRDTIVSYGERLSATILSAVIDGAELKDSRELIRTTRYFDKHIVDFEETTECLRSAFVFQPRIAVMGGFISSDRDTGDVTNLGRGGSDYTAAIVAAVLNAEMLEIWTDVDGFMTADPRVINNAYVIGHLTFAEATELCNFGAKVVYPPTIFPVYHKNIPIRIKNTFNPDADGTLISNDYVSDDRSIKGISSINDTCLLTIQGLGMVGVIGVNHRIFRTLAEAGISVFFVSQAASENTTSIGVSESDADKAAAELAREFAKEISQGEINGIKAEHGLATVAIVGENMKHTPGIAGRLFGTLGRNGINVIACAQGATETNISFVIRLSSLRKALNVIHDSFFLSEYQVLNVFVAGIGLVGSDLLDQIAKQQQKLAEENSLKINVVGIANSRRMIIDREGIDLHDYRRLLAESGIESSSQRYADYIVRTNIFNSVFVDCTASAEVAATYQRLLEANVSVVAANKIAASSDYGSYNRLKQTARRRGIKFLYETNVGAGLPIINTIGSLIKSGDRILRIEAVVSGTLNYIFDVMSAEVPLSRAIRMACEAGYAEPDPRIDLSGSDVVRKLVILSREAEYRIEQSDVDRRLFIPDEYFEGPIDEFWRRIPELDEKFESERRRLEAEGLRWRFVAELDHGCASVGLKEIGPDNPLYNLSGSNNVISLTTERYKEFPMQIKGYGAGASVTAAGVFADIISIANIR